MAGYRIIDVEGIGPAYAEKLKGAGVRTTAHLLDLAKDPKGRKSLAVAAEIDESRILKWANLADLMRIRGVAEEYSELLEAAGVDTVRELKGRNAHNLAAQIAKVNAERKLVRQVPSEKQVAGWIEQAKSLPPMLTY